MSDYTPTTDDVRDLVTMPWHEPANYDYEHEVARFNRWLASVERAAAEKAVAGLVKYVSDRIEDYMSIGTLDVLATEYVRTEAYRREGGEEQ